MEEDFNTFHPDKVRMVQLKPKNKKKSKKKEPSVIKNQSQSQDSDVQQWAKKSVGFLKSNEAWGNQYRGNEWVQAQKQIQQSAIVNKVQQQPSPSENHKITYLQFDRPSTQKSQGLFQDEKFPKNQSSLTGEWGTLKKYEQVKWDRASVRIQNYAIFSDRVAPKNIIQGKLGDCYFLSAVAALAERPDRLFGTFLNHDLNPERRFSLKVLLKGRWQVVDLDQYFPFLPDKPVFSRSLERQVWVMALEKAWAKIYGSYMNISAGHAEQCLHDFTGAPITFFKLKKKDLDEEKLWKYLLKASRREYAMCASSNAGSDTKMSETGIVQGHCYTLLNATYLRYKNKKVKLLQMRNPWGRKESRGNWSDTDPRWKEVSQQQKQRICFNPSQKDGIFYIDLQDFLVQYRAIVVAQINDNASYVYETAKDPNSKGVVFKVQIKQKTRYSFQIDKTPKRLFPVKKRALYNYPPAFCKIFSAAQGLKDIHHFHDSERLTSRKYTLSKGIYFVFVLIQFDNQFQTDFEVTLAVYAEHPCSITIATETQRQKLGSIQLPAQKEQKKKRHKSTPKPSEAEPQQDQPIILRRANIKFNYVSPYRNDSPAPEPTPVPPVNVQIKNKKHSGLSVVSGSNKKGSNTQTFNVIETLKKQNWAQEIKKMQNTQTVTNDQIDINALIKKQLVFIEPSPAEQKLKQLLQKKQIFNDDRFPPNLLSLTGQWGLIPQWQNIRWQRLSKTMPEAKIFKSKITPNSIKQGFLGDCYFLAGLAALAEKPERILNLFLLHQRNEINYYSLKILYRGKWLTIDIDDYVPYLYDLPAFSIAVQGQLWVILLEKAWAKVYTNYKRIDAGFPEQTLHDLTSAPIRHIYLQKSSFEPEAEWIYLLKASKQQYAMVASSQSGSDSHKSASGIVQGHAYTLLQVVQVNLKQSASKYRLVQLRNPWGKGQGSAAWSDNDTEWDIIDESQKNRIGYSKQQDGVFFITYELFCKQFKIITVAQINDNASYVYRSCKDNLKQGCFFTTKITQKGFYSFQIDNTPQRIFEDHYKSDYQYPNISFELGIMTDKGYLKRLVSLSSNPRTLFHKDTFEPGTYICYVRTDFNPRFQKDFQLNLAIYGDFPCTLTLSTKQEAVNFTNNPNVLWPRPEPLKPQQQWNTLRSFRPDKTKKI